MCKEPIKILFLSATSAAFEWQNALVYYAPREYTIYLNGDAVCTARTNVFSLFGLTPNKEYTLTCDLCDLSLTFRTPSETIAVSVREFGAKGDGVRDDTVAIQTAINCLPAGARLLFPSGTYLTSPICLKSHLTIEIAKDAVILGQTSKSAYPIIPAEVQGLRDEESLLCGTWEGNACRMYQSLFFAEHAEDITLIGPGTIDGNAQNGTWWSERKTDPVSRPRLLFFNRCRSIRIHGIQAMNAPSWHIHPYFSTEVRLIDVKVTAPEDSPNTDAIDPEACECVDIIGCRLSVGDDCVAIKSGKIEIANKFHQPADRHTVRNCLMERGHGAITLGSEISGGVKNLTVSQCLFEKTDRGIRTKTRRGRGESSRIDGLLFENLRMVGVLTPIVFNMWYNRCDPDRDSEYVYTRESLPVDKRTPYLGAFTFRNLECIDCEVCACYFDGLPEMPIQSITLENILFAFCENARAGVPAMRAFIQPFLKSGMYFDNVKHLRIQNVKVEGVLGDQLLTHNVQHLIEE